MVTMAYLSDWDFSDDLPPDNAARLTHVLYSFARIVNGRASVDHWKNHERLRDTMRRYPDLQIGLAIGGWGADGFSQAMAAPDTRAALVDSLAALVEDRGFDGVDIDWEYPCDGGAGIAHCPEDRQRFPLFVRLLREALDRLGEKTSRRYFITMAVGAVEGCAKNLDFENMIDCLDYINIMTYDMGRLASFSGHHTNLRASSDPVKNAHGAEQATDIFVRYGVPPEKIVIGAAFYGLTCRVAERGMKDGLHMPRIPNSADTANYPDLIRRSESGSARIFWDEAACAPYLYDEADGFFATFDNERSVRLKREFARDRGLGGIMFWEYNNDKTGVLLAALSGE